MTKMDKAPVTVRQNSSGKEITVESEQTPRKTEVGCYFIAKFNHLGIKFLQKKYPDAEITDKDSLQEFLAEKLGMPESLAENAFDSLSRWRYPDEKEAWTVEVDGEEFKGITKSREEEQGSSSDEVVTEPEEVEGTETEDPIEVSADDTDSMTEKDAKNVRKILEALDNGVPREKLEEALIDQKGEDEAERLLALADSQGEESEEEDDEEEEAVVAFD